MGISSLSDMYTQSARVTGLRAEGVHIRQTMSAHACHNYIVIQIAVYTHAI